MFRKNGLVDNVFVPNVNKLSLLIIIIVKEYTFSKTNIFVKL